MKTAKNILTALVLISGAMSFFNVFNNNIPMSVCLFFLSATLLLTGIESKKNNDKNRAFMYFTVSCAVFASFIYFVYTSFFMR